MTNPKDKQREYSHKFLAGIKARGMVQRSFVLPIEIVAEVKALIKQRRIELGK